MSDIREYRVVYRRFPSFGFLGCAGCLGTIFILGGIIGLLWQGWKSLLGL